jgi:hypothetical protein
LAIDSWRGKRKTCARKRGSKHDPHHRSQHIPISKGERHRLQQFRFATGKNANWSKVKYAFFTGPRTFLVDREGIKLQFRFTGLGWRLNDIELGLSHPQR